MPSSIHTLWLAALLGAAPLPTAEAPAPEPASNVLLVIADDLGTDMFKPYGLGQDIPRTPNLNLLAQQGVLFENAWAAPICSPSRACIETGRFGFRTGVGFTVKNSATYDGLPASEIILPEMLDAGTHGRYAHALFGKWHLNHASVIDLSGAPKGPDVVRVQGYGHHAGGLHNIVPPDSYFDWPKVTDGVKSRSTVYATTAVVDDFLAWHATVAGPWFAVLSFHAPHTPLHAPPAHLHSVNLQFVGPPQAAPRAHYRAMVEAMDTELGRALAALGDELDDTTVIFIGDNGTPLRIVNADPHGTLAFGHGKGTLFEGGVRVPLFVTGPRVTAPGTSSEALVHAVDVFATVAELAGVDLENPAVYPPQRTLDSRSLVPFLSDPDHPSRRRVNLAEKFLENTTAAAQVDGTQFHREHLCQDPVEWTVVPGAPRLTVCGDPVAGDTANEATLWLSGAPPAARAFLLAGGYNPKPNPTYGGQVTVTPKPLKQLATAAGNLNLKQALLTDAAGELVVDGVLYQKGLAVDYWVQFAVEDPVTLDWHLSNAVRVDQTLNLKAAVDEQGFKLISHVNTGADRLYHLRTDPREETDLLANGLFALTPPQLRAYLELRAAIEERLASAREGGGR